MAFNFTNGSDEGVDTKKQKVTIEDPHNTETSLNIEGNWSSEKGECTLDKSTKESAVLEKSSEDGPFFRDFAAPSVDFDAYRRYAASVKRNLSNKDSYKGGEGLYRSLINDVSLLEFTSLYLFFCGANHRNCSECQIFLNCAKDILNYGVIDVKTVYCRRFPETKYIRNKNVGRLMQLPVAVFTLSLQGPGSQ